MEGETLESKSLRADVVRSSAQDEGNALTALLMAQPLNTLVKPVLSKQTREQRSGEFLPQSIAAALMLLLAFATQGCAFHRTLERTFNPDTRTYDVTKFTGIVFFQKTATQGLTVGKRTSTGSTTLSVDKTATETQADALRAVAEGAAAGAVKGARP